MKTLLVALVIVFIGVHALPFDKQQIRWNLVKDQEGNARIVDLNPVKIEDEPNPFYDPFTDIRFLLFTRRNPTVGQVLSFDMNTVRNSNWNAASDLRFVLHGWNGGPESAHNIFITRELLGIDDHNVIVIDWSAGSTTPNYITARQRVAMTGQAVAVFIDSLHEAGFTDHSRINIIGHSLGSHVAGFMGKSVTRGRIATIFATDPAGPLFNINNPEERLTENDAVYTESIITNIGQLGFDEPITHSAFYPNWGGPSQPGCGVDVSGACAHSRSNELYSESLTSDRLVGRQCTDYSQIVARNCPGTGAFAVFGSDRGRHTRGVYFFETNAETPFGRG